MFTDKNFRPIVSMSVKCDVRKTPDNQNITFGDDPTVYSISKVEFKHINPTLPMIVAGLEAGHCLGQVYDEDIYWHKHGFSFKKHWKGSSWIGIDIDDTEVDMQTMQQELMREPTFIMTTQSHRIRGRKNRYRLYYFFNVLLDNYEGFRMIGSVLVTDVRNVLRNHGEDGTAVDCTTDQPEQFYYGNPFTNCHTIASWKIYTPDEVYAKYNTQSTSGPQQLLKDAGDRPEKKEEVLYTGVWPKLRDCCLNPKCSFEYIVKRFHKYYHIRFKTKVEYPADGNAFILPPKNYMYLRFRWDKHLSLDGRTAQCVINKWRNWDRRRRKLTAQLELIAYMHNFELTIDQLVFHAIYLFHVAYCNLEPDGTKCSGNDYITPKEVMDIARRVYQLNKKDMEELVKAELKKDECAYLVNRAEAEKRGISVLKRLGEARHEYTEYRWRRWLKILRPYAEQGLSNNKLAEILEQETATKKKPGVKFTPKTIGSHVAKFREYRKKDVEGVGEKPVEMLNRTTKTLGISDLNVKNALISENNEFWGSFSTFEQPSSPVAPTASLTPSTSSTPTFTASTDTSVPSPSVVTDIMGGILTGTDQIGVNKRSMSEANEARFLDAKHKEKRFAELYNPQLRDKENCEVITAAIGISPSHYYNLKKVHVTPRIATSHKRPKSVKSQRRG